MLIIVFQYTIETWKNNLQILKKQSLQNTKFMSLPKLLALIVDWAIEFRPGFSWLMAQYFLFFYFFI